ncbi:Peptidase family m48 family protein [Thalictrum thalictroides]|uniref:Peptidase family m48 family protein n=1 Tax=Thalictrum thalictroides TaxID=46969 RepID=A0A7J6X6M7_THATH|nr:Peptidase family m48 family protein [Thalictrum thalictroides]
MLQSLMAKRSLLLRSIPFSYAPSSIVLPHQFQFQFQKQQNRSTSSQKQQNRSTSSTSIGKVFLASGVLVSLYYYLNVDVVPFLKCRRFRPFPTCIERYLAERELRKLSINNVLHVKDPQSVRVKWILNDIVDGLRRELLENKDPSFISFTLCRHLGKLSWEVFLVDDGELPVMFCVAGSGKIIVNLKWLQCYEEDDNLALAIAHEIAHNVARHMAEDYLVAELYKIFYMPLLLNRWVNIRLRQEIEADRIGLMLLASAGYDPRLAPKIFKKMEQLQDSTHVVTHPPPKERVQLLAPYMEEALAIYNKVQASHLIQVRKEGGLELILRKIRSEED